MTYVEFEGNDMLDIRRMLESLEDEIGPKIWLVLVWLATLDVLNCINHQEEKVPIVSAKLSSEDPSRFATSSWINVDKSSAETFLLSLILKVLEWLCLLTPFRDIEFVSAVISSIYLPVMLIYFEESQFTRVLDWTPKPMCILD